MNASRFITFVTYMLRQNGIRFYKGLYVTFKLTHDLKQNTLYLSIYRPLNVGHFSILTISMLRTYQWYRRAYNSSKIGEISWTFYGSIPIYLYNDSVKVAKIRHVLVKLHRIVFTKVSLCLKINGKQNTTFQFSVKLFSNKMHEATVKLVLTQRQYVDRSYWVVASNHWRIVGNFLNAEKAFLLSQKCLKWRGYRTYT